MYLYPVCWRAAYHPLADSLRLVCLVSGFESGLLVQRFGLRGWEGVAGGRNEHVADGARVGHGDMGWAALSDCTSPRPILCIFCCAVHVVNWLICGLRLKLFFGCVFVDSLLDLKDVEVGFVGD